MSIPESHVPLILIADDQLDVLKALRLLLKGQGYESETVTSPTGVLMALAARDFDLVLIDLNYARDTTSGEEGLDLLARIQALDSALPVVVITAWGSLELAVEAMRRGARDFVQKPWDNERLLTIVRTQVELGRALRKGRRLEAELRLLHDQKGSELIAESRSMEPVLQLIARVSKSDANVLITGENGTGKGLVARMLHAAWAHGSKPMVVVDAGSLSEAVFESELFGHVAGAFTDARSDRAGRIELADGGTLFLDEIGNVPFRMQGKLLRVVESGEFERVGCSRTRRADVRIISATNADLDREVASGRFRKDLLFRLNTIEIRLPPLRDRREDIPILAMHFLRRHSQHYRKSVDRFDAAAMQALLDCPWPGNVRELDHVVERSVIMTQGDVVQPSDLGLRIEGPESVRLEDLTLEKVERVLIEKALHRFDGNVSRAAEALGLSRTALYRRLEKYGHLKGPGGSEP